MTSAVKQTTFEEYYETMVVMLAYLDKELTHIKNRQKNLSVWKGYKNYLEFLKTIERDALKHTIKELGLAKTTIRDRWMVMTLPAPVYCSIESGDITFSKAKIMTSINFDFENDSDIKVADEIVEQIKSGISNPEIKELVKTRSPDVWNPSTIVIQKIAEQHGLLNDTKC